MSKNLMALALTLACCTGVIADTVSVCLDGSCDFTDIQAAINASANGDIIEIRAGTYSPPTTLSLAGKSVVLRGQLDANGIPQTIFDGGGNRQILALSSSSATIEGIRFQNGRASAGGAMTIGAGSPQVIRCVFISNHATQFGGGVHAYQSAPTFVQCRFESNTAIINGGGLYPVLSQSTFIGCVVTGNTAPNGSGMFLAGACTCLTQLIDTIVCGNTNTGGGPSQVFGAGGNQWTGDPYTCVHADCAACYPDCDGNGIPDAAEIAGGAADINGDRIPDDCQCLADLFADGQVDGADLGILLNQWGLGKGAVADINRDGAVDGADLSILLNSWGACP